MNSRKIGTHGRWTEHSHGVLIEHDSLPELQRHHDGAREVLLRVRRTDPQAKRRSIHARALGYLRQRGVLCVPGPHHRVIVCCRLHAAVHRLHHGNRSPAVPKKILGSVHPRKAVAGYDSHVKRAQPNRDPVAHALLRAAPRLISALGGHRHESMQHAGVRAPRGVFNGVGASIHNCKACKKCWSTSRRELSSSLPT
jgi:hypothetical protein